MLATTAALLLLIFYIGSYYHLSRRGIAEAKRFRADGFLYTPFGETITSQDLTRHHTLARLFAPINFLDRYVLGTLGPIKCMLFELS